MAVQLAQRWIHARLRNRRLTSLAELNAAIRELLEQFNNRRTRHLGASRRELFDQLERHALQALPVEPYVFAEWRCRKVGLDYHVEIDRHYYSVPHTLLKAQVWVRITNRTIEIFHEDQRVASHARTSGNRKHSTVLDHMPPNHRAYADWTPDRLCRWAAKVPRIFRQLVKADLLILDDWGPERMTAPQRRDLMEIVEDRYGSGATLVTSQLPVDAWHDIVDEPTFADAILDRLIHNAHRLSLNGPSMRKTRDAPTAKTIDEDADT